MEIPLPVKYSITSAAMKAKLLFDTYQWKWSDGNGIEYMPSIKYIEAVYIHLVTEIMEQAAHIDDDTKESIGWGNAETGRLVVLYVDGIWTFSINLTWATDDGSAGDNEPNLRGSIVNKSQLGIVT